MFFFFRKKEIITSASSKNQTTGRTLFHNHYDKIKFVKTKNKKLISILQWQNGFKSGGLFFSQLWQQSVMQQLRQYHKLGIVTHRSHTFSECSDLRDRRLLRALHTPCWASDGLHGWRHTERDECRLWYRIITENTTKTMKNKLDVCQAGQLANESHAEPYPLGPYDVVDLSVICRVLFRE